MCIGLLLLFHMTALSYMRSLCSLINLFLRSSIFLSIYTFFWFVCQEKCFTNQYSIKTFLLKQWSQKLESEMIPTSKQLLELMSPVWKINLKLFQLRLYILLKVTIWWGCLLYTSPRPLQWKICKINTLTGHFNRYNGHIWYDVYLI